MRDEGRVYAFDRSHNKVAEIQSLAGELGLTCISAHRMDASKACKDVNQDLKGTKSQDEGRQSASLAVTGPGWLSLRNSVHLLARQFHSSAECKTGFKGYLECIFVVGSGDLEQVPSNSAGPGMTQCSSLDGRLRGQEKIDARKRRKAAAALAKGQPLPKQQAQPTAPLEVPPEPR